VPGSARQQSLLGVKTTLAVSIWRTTCCAS